ncbi:MAG: HAMP domain-containing histidine kinase [Defluviitaleaceae bacterium]|nr:HAMP domain-containing histidine kinase [Defluviitaleaceae bacterium]
MNKKKMKLNLTVSLSLYILCIMTVAMLITLIIMRTAEHFEFFGLTENGFDGGGLAALLFLILVCAMLGTAVSIFFNKRALSPIRRLIQAMNKVADGNFDIELDLQGITELESLSASFNKMTKGLASTETLRKDFINNFSHEFKTPIVSIRGFAKLLKEGELSKEERQEYLEIIIAETERLANLSTSILNLSKYENMQIILEKKPFRLDEQIRRSILLLEPKWSKKELCLNVELEEVTFAGDENITGQIWVNLIDNAIKFSHNNGVIDINLKTENSQIVFAIMDKGVGMAEQTQQHIFDKFYQGDKSHAEMGNGLGLSIVKSITELYKGKIEVKSSLNEGSTFKVRFYR